MTAILGISAFYHDSAAALVVDGRTVAAAQQERFSRKKHDASFPQQAIDYCLSEAGIGPEELDYVGFYDKPLLKFDRLIETYLAYAPAGCRSFAKVVSTWLKQKLHLPREISRGLGGKYRKRFVFTEHHESHAASAFFPSPFEEAAILTVDGVGEWATASFGIGRGNRIQLTHEMHFPHSLGMLYSAFTYYCGFRVNSGEYKLMGLAPYGEPIYADTIMEHLIDLKQDGSFRMNMSYFNYCQGLTMTSRKFHALFGAPPRTPESQLTQQHMDIAASVQQVTEEIMLRMARHVHRQTGLKRLCLAGGVALNCVANGRLLREGLFEDIWIQPAAGDAGGALGVAQFIWHQLLDHPRTPQVPDGAEGSCLGPQFADEEIESCLKQAGAGFRLFQSDEELCDYVAGLIADGKVVGWMQGRMEFGPRALGRRSILADARDMEMQSVINAKIKFRESFRPFAPAILQEHVDDYFELPPGSSSPYMMLVAPVAPQRRVELNDQQKNLSGLGKLKVRRSDMPAVTHVDHSARVQTVDPQRHGRFYRLLKAFAAKTGTPLMINTSFNIRGEPIVCTPADAYRCFINTGLDALVLEKFVLLKDEQPSAKRYEAEANLVKAQPD